MGQLNPKVPGPLRWLVERCLAKDPEDRFGTTKDLAHDLADVRDHLSDAPVSGITGQQPVAVARSAGRTWPWIAGALALAAAVGAAAFTAGELRGMMLVSSIHESLSMRAATPAADRRTYLSECARPD